MAQLETGAQALEWRDGRFVNVGLGPKPLPLAIDALPQGPQLASLVRKMGDLSKNVRRVEVPFHRIAPAEDAYWTCDSRSAIDVPLGRAGATKLQYLRLGQGTSQHVLISGKTGSGKSTLMHVIVTDVCLRYSPDEIELYLVDFKKGVEFKTYATHRLPHARVVAVESDREFGTSVLERLDAVLEERGELFRQFGVQDIAAFRNESAGARLPRILLIVDEFQEFFVEDDRYSQTAALLLDRLVRQGRAFGIHVLLGSQTLGGAYSLARTTIGQMAVRIALQCSESDA
ncbi:MAG TPA: FtsK/SpoIIIE domain-containing protein, partial [Planctomycetaceae bacterium]|nr:FtsK/SpoIIIE domain-containing protein [Planctomycetaceae bacterium]